MDRRQGAELRRARGYFTLPEVAELLGVNRWTFCDWAERGLIPKPTVRMAGPRLYYPASVVKTLKEEIRRTVP